MATTVVAVFDNQGDAQDAKSELREMGIPESNVTITANESTGGPLEHVNVADRDDTSQLSFGERIAHFFRSMFGSDDDDERVGRYSEAVRRGSCVLTVHLADDAELDAVSDVLHRHDAIDIEDRAEQWRSQGWSGYDPAAQPLSQTELDAERSRYGMSGNQVRLDSDEGIRSSEGAGALRSAGEEETLPVIEEELKVGKREVQRGGVRVYVHTTEVPVEEQVNLREERARVERRPVDRPATKAELAAAQDKSIELTETSEEPVVSKTARVVEEVVIGKEVRNRTETVGDVVRRTDVEVEREDSEREPGVAQNLDTNKPGASRNR